MVIVAFVTRMLASYLMTGVSVCGLLSRRPILRCLPATSTLSPQLLRPHPHLWISLGKCRSFIKVSVSFTKSLNWRMGKRARGRSLPYERGESMVFKCFPCKKDGLICRTSIPLMGERLMILPIDSREMEWLEAFLQVVEWMEDTFPEPAVEAMGSQVTA
ncbi:hypothetical protein B0T21DRAFT_62111 [Apiosordaria backusii]|uniref:Uncharacterized protein n=1 Tax=Apiosordaria backusii TaxID=314023 RepID=A0AA40AIH8_9PEZI|nr:hypothetical protein B0T21DRAFT_62111 [Apiosordaria backusii]